MAGPSRAERREQVRDELLTLIERMLDDGEAFADISVERLASAAGMSRTRFYLYFEDKYDLFEAWFDRIGDELAAAAAPWWNAPRRLSRRRLSEVLTAVLRTYRPHATLMAAFDEAAAADAGLRARVDAQLTADAAALREHIERGQTRATVHPSVDSDAIARWITIMLWRGRRHLIRNADEAELTRIAAAPATLIWNVLYANAA